MTNQPPFDPLNSTTEESDDMLAGYLASAGDEKMPDLASIAYEHGYRMGRNDRAGIADDDQRELARRAAEIRRDADERRRRMRAGLQRPTARFKP